MKKNVFMYVVATFVCMVLMACSGEGRPFKALSNCMADYAQSLLNNFELMYDETHRQTFEKKRNELCTELEGKTIPVEIENGLGFELVSDQAKIGKGYETHVYGESGIRIPIDIDLKVTDAAGLANDLMVLVYADDEIVDARHLTEHGWNMQDMSSIQRMEFVITPFLAHRFANVSKLVVTKFDENVFSSIEQEHIKIREKTRQDPGR